MRTRPQTLATVVVAACFAWHLLAILAPAWANVAVRNKKGKDFATYYYAMEVAWQGDNPYDTPVLGRAAQRHGTRAAVHPFLYPPPFLLIVLWSVPLELVSAYKVWFWLDELWLAAAVLALWRWWRPMGSAVTVALAVAVAVFTAIPANHEMGQANFPGLALAMLGLWQDARGRKVLGGVLVGAACMVKMSPALFVAWWLMKRNWVAAGAACVTAVLLSAAVLPITGFAVQKDFYTEVLSTFGSGDYNGLAIPIGMFGNHSIPNIYHQIFPSHGAELSPVAQGLSSLTSITLVLGLGWWFRHDDGDDLQRAGQVGAIGVALLLVPVYTYEHHVVWAIPAIVAAVVAVSHGRLGAVWAIPLGLAVGVWSFEILDMKRLYYGIRGVSGDLATVFQELKFAALLVFLAASAVTGTRKTGDAASPEEAP